MNVNRKTSAGACGQRRYCRCEAPHVFFFCAKKKQTNKTNSTAGEKTNTQCAYLAERKKHRTSLLPSLWLLARPGNHLHREHLLPRLPGRHPDDHRAVGRLGHGVVVIVVRCGGGRDRRAAVCWRGRSHRGLGGMARWQPMVSQPSITI